MVAADNMNDDPTHYPMSKTLKGIRSRAGFSIDELSQYLEVPAERIRQFEACALPDLDLLHHYGRMAGERDDRSHNRR